MLQTEYQVKLVVAGKTSFTEASQLILFRPGPEFLDLYSDWLRDSVIDKRGVRGNSFHSVRSVCEVQSRLVLIPMHVMASINKGMRLKDVFLNRLLAINDHEKKEDHFNIMTKETYANLVNEIEEAQLAVQKSQKQHRRLKRFKVINIGGIRKLVTRLDPIKYYLCADEIYDIIEAAHVAIGHGGRDKLRNETSRSYANITLEMINIFLSMCETCQRKKSMKKRTDVSKSRLHFEMNSRCQVDLIDMQTQEDRGSKFIMVYQDHATKFVLLRALTSNRAKEVAFQLTDIFLTFGAPCILHSAHGREFVNSVLNEVASFWPECELVYGKPRHSQSQESVERANKDIEKMLSSWMQANDTTHWENGIRFVQFMKNRALHSGTKQSPYKAMFGIEPRVGLMTSTLPRDVIEGLRDEHDLENALNKINMTHSTDISETKPIPSCNKHHQIITGDQEKYPENSYKTIEESPIKAEPSEYDIEVEAFTSTLVEPNRPIKTEPVPSSSENHQIFTGAKQKYAESSYKTRGELPIKAEPREYDIEAEAFTSRNVEPCKILPINKDINVAKNVMRQIMAPSGIAHQNFGSKQTKRIKLEFPQDLNIEIDNA